MNQKLPGCKFHHVAINTVNYAKTVAFYEALGFTTVSSWGEAPKRACMMDLGDGGMIEVFEAEKESGFDGKWLHLALCVASTHDAYDYALSIGAKSKMKPTKITVDDKKGAYNIEISFIIGPNGEEIELYQYR